MNFTSYNDFLKSFDIPEKIKYTEYKSKLKLLAKYGETYEEAKLFVEWANESELWTDELIEDFCPDIESWHPVLGDTKTAE